MARYRIAHAYRSQSDGRVYGPWVAGDVVDLTDVEAAWLTADSPGLLSPDTPKLRQATPLPNRQAKPGRNRGL